MAEQIITKDRLDYTIDILVAMVVEELSSTLNKDTNEVITMFIHSKTGKALYEPSTKLWCNGPSYIADMFIDEIRNNEKM